jgi:hypothetical protein
MIGMVFLITQGWSVVRRTLSIAIIVVGAGVNLFGSLQSSMEFYVLFYRSPENGIFFPLPFRPEEEIIIGRQFSVERLDFPPARLSPCAVQSSRCANSRPPLTDSLYVPQHTQWAGYPVMLQLGYCDWWLLGQAVGNRGIEPGKSPD